MDSVVELVIAVVAVVAVEDDCVRSGLRAVGVRFSQLLLLIILCFTLLVIITGFIFRLVLQLRFEFVSGIFVLASFVLDGETERLVEL